MNDTGLKMTPLAARLGLGAALLSAVMFLIFTVCFVMILMTPPLFYWTDLPAYVAHVQRHNQFWKHLAQLTMLLFGPLFVLLLNSVYDGATDDKKILARISLCFGILFAAVTGIHYFVQLSAVRFSLEQGQVAGLAQWIQSNPASAVLAINMLGMTLFLGLASLFVAPLFRGGKLERMISTLFWLNGLFCLVGGVGFGLQKSLWVFWTINFGMGGAVTAVMILLTVWFARQGPRRAGV